MIIQNEFISIETAGRRLASVVVQDKINGRSYCTGNNIFPASSWKPAQTKQAP